MELGFLPEFVHGGAAGSTLWYPGVPEPVKFLGVTVSYAKIDYAKAKPVQALRCGACGVLKFYAIGLGDAGPEAPASVAAE
jgi:hypothetical protein